VGTDGLSVVHPAPQQAADAIFALLEHGWSGAYPAT
jgi:hypothetical protein